MMGLTFFYSRENGSAAVGMITPDKFTTTKEFGQGSFGNWTHVVARAPTLLFYNRGNGAAAMGTLTAGDFTTDVKFEPGRFGIWTHLIGTNPGWLFYNRMTGAAAIGDLQTPGVAVSFATTGSFADLAEWSHIVADGDTVLFYNQLNGGAAIATVTPTSLTTNTTYQPGSFGAWTHVVNDGPTVLFYNRDTGASAIGTLSPNSFTTNIGYNPGSFGVWTHVASDSATVIFYNSDTGAAALGTLAPSAFTSTTFYQPGQFSRHWTHLIGDSSSGPEDLELKFAVLLCQWQRPPSSTTVFPAEYYRHYMFDLSAEHGIGRYWFDQSGGQLRFTGYVNDWIPLSKAPSDPSIHHNSVEDRQLLAEFTIAEAKRAGWTPGNETCIVIIVACPGAQGVNGGALGAPITVDGIDRYVAILHGDSANWIASSGGNVLGSNYRFDFNAHEVGHLVGDLFSFAHAFGPGGVYDHPYCIMAAETYGGLGLAATYDDWFAGSNRPPEEHTKGPGLSGTTRAACGWARVRRLGLVDLQQGVELYLAHLGDHGSTLPQVIEYPTQVSGAPATYTIEFRSRLAERDQALAPAIVFCQREGSQWSSNPTWAPRSSTFLERALIPSSGALPSLTLPGILHAEVLEMAPPETIGGLSGPPWIRIRLSA
jgi:hypothetical protein